MSNTRTLYVNMAGESPCFSTVSEALSAVQEWDADAPAQAKSFPAPPFSGEQIIIRIGSGVYREKLVITRPGITLLGEGHDKTTLVFGQGAFDPMPDGSSRGTFRTASLRVDASDFTARHLTVQNDAGPGRTAGQAIALYVDGDRCYFEDCKLLGCQDTLFLAPLPETEFQPGGFRGPGEHAPRVLCRSLFRNCFIQGDIDFIFGGGIAYFESCTLFSKMPEAAADAEPPICGYVTAASTPEGQPFGFVFRYCRLLSDCPAGSVYLGRPWREYAKTVFLNCFLGPHICSEGWQDWGKTHGNFYYAEHESFGPGCYGRDRLPQDAKRKDCLAKYPRAAFSMQLNSNQIREYTLRNILRGWIPGDYLM